jgi:putative peptidoglycan lipid II flippase
MVNRILKLFHKEIAGVHQAALLLGTFTLASQVLALIRDRLLAHQFGAGHLLDLYYTAFRIPDLIYAAVASLVSISVLIPFFSSISEEGKRDSQKLLSSIFTVFMLVMVFVSLIAFCAMPYLVHTFFAKIGSSDADLVLLVNLSRILLLQPICLGVSNVLGVVTQIGKRFFLYAVSPLLYNIAIIYGIMVLYPIFGMVGIVYGVVLGGVLHFLIQIPYVRKVQLLPSFTTRIDFNVVKKVIQISIPRTIGLSANMFELIAITVFASGLVSGSVAIFNLALNLQSVPFAIVGVSYALAAFPTLSAYFARGEREQFMEQISTAARHIIFWSIPITALFIVLRAQIVRTILGSGQFNWEDTRLTAACLALFTVSLVAQGLELLFIRSYYAAGRTAKPLFVNLVSSVLTISLPYVCIQFFESSTTFRFFIESLFKVEGLKGSVVLMLPLGYTIGTLINACAFWVMFENDFGKMKKVFTTLLTSIEAAIVGGFSAYVGLNFFAPFFNQGTAVGIFLQGFLAGLFGIAASICVFLVLNSQELQEVWNALRQKNTRNKMIVSEPDKIEI